MRLNSIVSCALTLLPHVFAISFKRSPWSDEVLLPRQDSTDCKCLFGQPCWPSESDFAGLASQLSQPLIHPRPVALPCYPSTNFSSDACNEVLQNTENAIWRSDHPGAAEHVNYERYIFDNGTISACYTNATLGFPCEQGNIPPLGVNATTVEDIQAAVQFAKQHNLKVVIKSTGHDYLGRSSGRNSFLIWTHYMKERSFSAEFVPEGGPSNETYQAITVGSGVQWGEAYQLAGENNRFVVGGISANNSVGAAGGWIQGGGHSAFAPRHGLGVDNVLEFKIVLSDGSHVTSNAYTNSDLFWALRGGGGGTFGVLTSVTYKTHPIFPLTHIVVFGLVSPNNTDGAQKAITELIKLQPTLSDQHWGGYSYLSKDLLIALYFAPDVSPQDANSTFDPFIQAVQDAAIESSFAVATTPFESWNDYLTTPPESDPTSGDTFPTAPPPVGRNVELASRLIPRAITEQNPEEVARTFLSINNVVGLNSVAGGAVSEFNPDSVALHPGWRNASTMAWVAAGWEDGADAQTINQVIEKMKNETAVLDGLTTDSASYFNEGSRHEIDFKKTYWGPHYDCLAGIKSKYDPSSMFLVTSGVGSDGWDADLVCRRG